VEQNDESCVKLHCDIVESAKRSGSIQDIGSSLEGSVVKERIEDDETELLIAGGGDQRLEIELRMVGEVERRGLAGVRGQEERADTAPKRGFALLVVYE
jgi:hypothetical protein